MTTKISGTYLAAGMAAFSPRGEDLVAFTATVRIVDGAYIVAVHRDDRQAWTERHASATSGILTALADAVAAASGVGSRYYNESICEDVLACLTAQLAPYLPR